jgi:hypothetical protein
MTERGKTIPRLFNGIWNTNIIFTEYKAYTFYMPEINNDGKFDVFLTVHHDINLFNYKLDVQFLCLVIYVLH